MPSLPDIARATAERFAMLPDGEPVLALVSGGADSTALLRLLAARELGERPLAVLHVNHLLRGEDSDADADFVAALCEELGVPVRVVRYDVAAYGAENGLNLEDAGRRVRYRFAEEELDALAGPGRGRIAVAHTLDDNAETFLMRVLEGAGAAGLAGIPPVRGRIVRPLVEARRADVVAYLGALGQPWREDATNADVSRLRARVRREVMPALEAAEPRFPATLGRTLGLLAEEDALLAGMADGFVDAFTDRRDGEVVFDTAFLATLTRPMARRVVRTALLRAFPAASRLESAHVDALVEGLARPGFARDLPFGLRAFAEHATLVVSLQPGTRPPLAPALLDIPGRVDLGEAGEIVAEEVAPDAVSKDPLVAVLDADALVAPLVVDGPHEGDRIRPLGMSGTKKLSDLLAEAKVPRRERPAVPVVRNGTDVVWVGGLRMSDGYKVGPATRRAVRLTWRRDGGKGS